MNAFDTAAAVLEAAKINEARATAARIAAEQALLLLMPSKDEGSLTERGLLYKVTATYGINRTVDAAALAVLWPTLPEGVRRVFPHKPGLDMKELRHWMLNDPEVYAGHIAPLITAKPAKPSVKVEAMEIAKETA